MWRVIWHWGWRQLHLLRFFQQLMLRKYTKMADDCLHASRNPAILVPPHTNMWMSFCSRTVRELFNSSLLFGDIEKCFRIFLSELYNNTASRSLMVAEVVVHLTVPLAAWKEHHATGDWMPYLSAASWHAFKFVVQLSLHINVGTFMELWSNGWS